MSEKATATKTSKVSSGEIKKTAKKVVAKKEASVKKATPKKTTPEGDESFAVFETGGKQYTVSVGEIVRVEKIKGEYKEGESIKFDKVLLVDDGKNTSIGDPYLKGAAVSATLEKIGRSRKVDVVKYRAKSRYFKRNGHRQPFFEVKITAIL